MPDDGYSGFVKQIVAVLKADSAVIALVAKKTNNTPFVTVSKYGPVGNKYPQITVASDLQESEPILPAGMYNCQIVLWLSEKDSQHFSKSVSFQEICDRLFNRKADSLNNISGSPATGLRVAQMLRRFGEPEFDREHNKYKMDMRYDVVVSDGESYAEEDAGDKPWEFS